uniref:ribonuclease H n=1 Tax=Leptobrachium leishanense TaxID=445787 RepID=A0A8C5MQ68_9ANUR
MVSCRKTINKSSKRKNKTSSLKTFNNWKRLFRKTFWETWSQFGSGSKKKHLHIKNGNIWLNYFKSLYKDIPKEELTGEQEHIIRRLHELEEKIKDFQNPLDTPITAQEVAEKIQDLQSKKASGMDGILPEMIKHGSPEVHTAICKVFNLVLSVGFYPQVWNQGLITPIHKSGDQYDSANYRGICVSSTLGKLFNSIQNKRILSFLTQHNILNRSQAGFMPNHRTTDHIYTLHSLIKDHVHNTKHGKIFACFVDFKKAFDSVWHPGLFLKLLESGIGGKTYDVIKSSYNENFCSIKVNGKRTEYFRQARGVRQGCSLSPTLFNIYINGLAEALESSSAPGLTLHDTEVKFLLYADDLLLLSPTERGLQDSLEVLEKYSAAWALPINQKKTKVMVFQRKNAKTKRSSFTLNDCTLEEANSYTYLGLETNRSGNFKPAIEALRDKACRTFYAIRRNLYKLKPPVRVWLKIFDSVIAPILLYGTEVWGPITYPDQPKWDTSPTEIFHLEFCKHLLQVHQSTSNNACRAELGRLPLLLAVQKRALSYWDHLNISSLNSYHHKALLANKDHPKPCGLQQLISTLIIQSPHECNLTKYQIKALINDSRENDIREWRHDIANSQKLTIYQSLQREYKLAPYLEVLQDPKDRQILSRYRLSAHSLEIESGRHRQTYKPRENRLCQHCDQGALEDEVHFLLQFPKYSALKETHFQRLSALIPDFTSIEETRKLHIILGEEEPAVKISAQYVTECHRLRGT